MQLARRVKSYLQGPTMTQELAMIQGTPVLQFALCMDEQNFDQQHQLVHVLRSTYLLHKEFLVV